MTLGEDRVIFKAVNAVV